MTSLTADLSAELDGAGVRRFTRRATAARADTGLLTQVGDLVSALTSVAIMVAVLAGVLARLRERIAARPPVEAAVLPGAATAVVVALVLAGGVVGLLARLGPVSATPATAAWWLPLPAGRRGLLRGELRRVGLLAVVAAVAVALPVLLAGPAAPTTSGVLLELAVAALLAAAVVGGLAVLQSSGRTRWMGTVAGGVAAVAVVVPAVGASVAAALGRELADGTVLPTLPRIGTAALLAGTAVLAAVALVVADRRLGRLPAGALRNRGETAQYASASAVSLDTRELGRALGTVVRAPRRPRTWGWVTSPERAVVAADLAVLTRSPWRWGQLAVGAALPVLAARTRGLGELPPLVAVAAALGWGLAAVAVGEPSRRGHASPAADRALPLAEKAVVRARAVVPVAVLVVVCGVSALLVGQGAGSAWSWLALGIAVAPAWAGAAVRGGYRPELDWSGSVVSSPLGPLPSGVGATLVRGPDLGVLGTVPFAVALLLGEAPPVLVAAQLAWSLAIAALAVETARRKA
ncbi:hypothetical protein SAMN05661080_02633 [Modestobacter sp. DSM 44400]|uniref:DUF6297 family protein n=1 Tax=Modestobacter sp. DSM 44400 TaxID=1550230 RepID=UPI000894AAE1|nr:DUF6297 family protein [Modestobacter sp. DSM 44400]SDY18821.1 hypothetical protein SAMN05661080_02633 [Modestobacter sp. DSM 44400]